MSTESLHSIVGLAFFREYLETLIFPPCQWFSSIECMRTHVNACQNSQALRVKSWFQIYLHEPRNLRFAKAPTPTLWCLWWTLGSSVLCLRTCCSLRLWCYPVLTWPTPTHSSGPSSNKRHLFCDAFPNSPQVAVGPSRYHSNFHASFNFHSYLCEVLCSHKAVNFFSTEIFMHLLCPVVIPKSGTYVGGTHRIFLGLLSAWFLGAITMKIITVNWFSSTM